MERGGRRVDGEGEVGRNGREREGDVILVSRCLLEDSW